jgi:hypothetical protein
MACYYCLSVFLSFYIYKGTSADNYVGLGNIVKSVGLEFKYFGRPVLFTTSPIGLNQRAGAGIGVGVGVGNTDPITIGIEKGKNWVGKGSLSHQMSEMKEKGRMRFQQLGQISVGLGSGSLSASRLPEVDRDMIWGMRKQLVDSPHAGMFQSKFQSNFKSKFKI